MPLAAIKQGKDVFTLIVRKGFVGVIFAEF